MVKQYIHTLTIYFVSVRLNVYSYFLFIIQIDCLDWLNYIRQVILFLKMTTFFFQWHHLRPPVRSKVRQSTARTSPLSVCLRKAPRLPLISGSVEIPTTCLVLQIREPLTVSISDTVSDKTTDPGKYVNRRHIFVCKRITPPSDLLSCCYIAVLLFHVTFLTLPVSTNRVIICKQIRNNPKVTILYLP